MKVAIVGAGVMGMMLARELGQAGVSVTLLDKGLCGKEATWAGGGIVSPLYPWRYPDSVTALAKWSQAYYPNLVESLEAESGIDAELTRQGLLMLDMDEASQASSWAKKMGSMLGVVDAKSLYQSEPGLVEGYDEALWMPLISSIRNPRLARALRKSIALEKNVHILEQQAIAGFVTQDGKGGAAGKVVGVKTGNETILADKVVICAGAWSNNLLNTIGLKIEVAPVRGQMILFKTEPGTVKTIVMKQGKYLIPRRDGRVLAGSTVEYEGFDKSTTPEAKEDLLAVAIELMPGLRKCPVEHHWAGLRPGSPEGVPYMGAVPGFDGLYMNAGHFRNGLVLSPASVRLMADILMDKTPFLDPSPYQLEGRVSRVGEPI